MQNFLCFRAGRGQEYRERAANPNTTHHTEHAERPLPSQLMEMTPLCSCKQLGNKTTHKNPASNTQEMEDSVSSSFFTNHLKTAAKVGEEIQMSMTSELTLAAKMHLDDALCSRDLGNLSIFSPAACLLRSFPIFSSEGLETIEICPVACTKAMLSKLALLPDELSPLTDFQCTDLDVHLCLYKANTSKMCACFSTDLSLCGQTPVSACLLLAACPKPSASWTPSLPSPLSYLRSAAVLQRGYLKCEH